MITGDKTWIFEYYPETKRQSKEWHTSASPRPRKARMSKLKIKSMLICFFDSQGVVHTEFMPQGQTVNQFYYHEILERLRKRVVCVRPSIANNWMLHHDNAPCHMVISVIKFLAKKGIPVVPQPPYSLDLSRCEFFLFPELKFDLKGRHFQTVENIETAVTDQLKVITVSDFQRCYKEWEQHLWRCVASEGNYFEGDKLDL